MNSGNLASRMITGPMEEPVQVDEVKTSHLGKLLSFTDDDVYISTLISAARRQAEIFTRRAFLTQTWEMYIDHFPGNSFDQNFARYNRNLEYRCIRVLRPPLQTVNLVKYLDPGGALQTMDPATYTVDKASEPGRITTNIGIPWPPTGRLPNAVIVNFTAGYADTTEEALAADPGFNMIKLAIMHLVGHWYQNREPVVAGQAMMLPMHVQNILLSVRAQQF